MPKPFAPMLAAKTPPAGHPYRFPLLASPKLDGIRAVVIDGRVYSRSLKLIRNTRVQWLFGCPEFNGLDGELIVGAPTGVDEEGNDVMQRTTSGVMSVDGEPDVTFHVFDCVCDPAWRFERRLDHAVDLFEGYCGFEMVPQVLIHTQEELDVFEGSMLALGYEGVMLRDPAGLYKFGRSTVKEGGLIKVKHFEDAEAEIIGFEERMHNGNEATVSELGRTKRSTHAANKTGRGDLGAFICRTPAGIEFNIGTGMSDEQRGEFWERREQILKAGWLAKYKSFTAAGVKDAPRFPVFLGLRAKDDT